MRINGREGSVGFRGRPRAWRFFSSLLLSIGALCTAETASALPCLGDTVGEPVNCTANDIRIIDFVDIVVTDDGCTSGDDTVTFDALVTVTTTATSRYDIGLFIGADGTQAIHGECEVRTLPTDPLPFRQLDGDACGDTSASMTVNVPVSNVTVACVDANRDHMLDLASCTSWRQNRARNCTGPADVSPGTAAKCNCPELPTDVPIFVPETVCTSNADCAGEATGCSDAICDPDNPGAASSGCVLVPSDANCDDGNFCNGAETCSATLGCQPGAPPDCDDGIACTNDACDEGMDVCVHATSDLLCSDDLFCNGAETCSVMFGCQPGAPPDCDDGIACTNDACDEGMDVCVHATSDLLCSDDLFCNGAETCSVMFGCQPGAPPDCDDGIACTNDACDEGLDVCKAVPDDTRCADGVFCNGAETCSATLGCLTGTPPDCADTVPCTADSCNETEGRCDRIPNHALCVDSNICTDDVCNPASGCTNTNNTASCDDHDPCTANDRCASGQCRAGSSLCGNGVVDAACGEACDPGSAEICTNGEDDDGDALVDCADPDCFEAQTPGCDAQCQVVPPCAPIFNDPAILYLAASEDIHRAQGSGRFSFHGRMVPFTPVDPLLDGFMLVLSNANGQIYRAEVAPGDLVKKTKGRYSLSGTAAATALEHGGIRSLRLRERRDGGETGYGFRVKASGDFSRATLPEMTTQVYFQEDTAYLSATWTPRPGRWTLDQSDY